MPYLVSTSFSKLLESITIVGDATKTANVRRDRIVELLDQKLTILNSFATGSLVRGTGLKNRSDVDVMLVLHYGKHLKNKTPRAALEAVQDALSGYDAQIVKKNGQAVTLYFKTWPNVDIVPAKRVTVGEGFSLHIPDSNTGSWIETDPASHDIAMSVASARKKQLIRAMKCWNEAHSSYFRSFHIEKVALACWVDENDAEEGAWPGQVKHFLERAIELTEPTAELSTEYEVGEWSELRSRLRRGQELAEAAWHACFRNDYATAIEKCRIIFGDKFPAYG